MKRQITTFSFKTNTRRIIITKHSGEYQQEEEEKRRMSENDCKRKFEIFSNRSDWIEEGKTFL